MKITRVNILLISAFAVVVGLLTSIAYLSWKSNHRQQEEDEWVLHTYEIIAQLESVFSQSRDAQIDARNFATTGKKEYLDSFILSKKQIPARLDHIYRLIMVNTPQQRKVLVIKELIEKRLAVNQELIDLSKQGDISRNSVEDILEKGRTILMQTRPLVAEVVAIERQLIQERKALADQSHGQTQWLLVLSVIASLTVIAIVFLLLRRELLQRIKNEDQLRQYEADLHKQLSHQQEQNQQLDQLNQALYRSNDNLQQFAYAASHDLQEPLRKIQSFGTLLRTQYAPNLGDTGADLLHRMESAANRMQVLIRDLLSYSRLTTHAGESQVIELNKLMKEILSELEWTAQQQNAQIQVSPLPVIEGYPQQISQLFHNLIGNALKFRQSGRKPEITVLSRKLLPHEKQSWMNDHVNQYVCIEVKDNGIGFEQKHEDRIFQLFQRLHGRDQYPGTGIGLALCKKVVENHKGEIKAVGQPNKGATFMVYLPVVDVLDQPSLYR